MSLHASKPQGPSWRGIIKVASIRHHLGLRDGLLDSGRDKYVVVTLQVQVGLSRCSLLLIGLTKHNHRKKKIRMRSNRPKNRNRTRQEDDRDNHADQTSRAKPLVELPYG